MKPAQNEVLWRDVVVTVMNIPVPHTGGFWSTKCSGKSLPYREFGESGRPVICRDRKLNTGNQTQAFPETPRVKRHPISFILPRI